MPAAYDRWLAPAVFQPFAVDLAQLTTHLGGGPVTAKMTAYVIEARAGGGR